MTDEVLVPAMATARTIVPFPAPHPAQVPPGRRAYYLARFRNIAEHVTHTATGEALTEAERDEFAQRLVAAIEAARATMLRDL